MERLTKQVGPHVYYIGFDCNNPDTGDIPAEMDTGEVRKVLHRLAAYEDTCLEPEEIYQQRFLIAALKDPEKLAHLRDIVLADEAGRLVVLPFEAKEGDPIPQCFYGDGGLCPGLSAPNDDEPIEMCKRCWYCSCGYRQEAENA